MSTTIKSEPADVGTSGGGVVVTQSIEPLELEEKIYELCSSYADGISDSELQNKIPPNIDAQQRAAAINRLLAKSKLELFKSGTMLIYRVKSSSDGTVAGGGKIAGATNEETAVYRLIEESKNKGIWIRDIKEILKLHVNTVNKVLKTLESRKLIKAIKPVGAAASKKIYMLFELEPDSSISGGAFYSGQEFDSQFVDLLNQQCLKYLRSKAQAAAEKFPNDFLAKRKSCLTSSKEILQHIKELKISKIDLSLADVEKILDTVVFDGNAQKESGVIGGDTFYAATMTSRSQTTFCTGLVKSPCAFCPLFEDCRPKGLVSPATCVYFKEWLAE